MSGLIHYLFGSGGGKERPIGEGYDQHRERDTGVLVTSWGSYVDGLRQPMTNRPPAGSYVTIHTHDQQEISVFVGSQLAGTNARDVLNQILSTDMIRVAARGNQWEFVHQGIWNIVLHTFTGEQWDTNGYLYHDAKRRREELYGKVLSIYKTAATQGDAIEREKISLAGA